MTLRARYEWAEDDVAEARSSGMDFDNHFHLECLNPKARGEMLRRYLVYSNTTGHRQQSPTWYPRRNLKRELLVKYRKAAKARKAGRAALVAFKNRILKRK